MQQLRLTLLRIALPLQCLVERGRVKDALEVLGAASALHILYDRRAGAAGNASAMCV